MYKITRTNIPKNASGIYQIQSIRNSKIYVGSAVNLRGRKYEHFANLKNKKHGNQHLQNHYTKYGNADLRFSVLEFCEKEKLIEREQFYINILKPVFNICQTAGSSLGTKRSQKSKQKMSKVNTKENNPFFRKCHSKEAKQKMSESGKGRIVSEETKQNMSAAHIGKQTGKNHPFFGKHHSEETKQKLRKANIGKHPSEETKQKMRKAREEYWKIRKAQNGYN